MVFALQVWMCGGELMIATCSHVGHVFRKSTPYTFPGGTSRIVNHNNARLAEVWLDEWKEFYFSINPGLKKKKRDSIPLKIYHSNLDIVNKSVKSCLFTILNNSLYKIEYA